MFSDRSDHDWEPNALTSAVRARTARGERVLDLTVSNPTTVGLPYDGPAILGANFCLRSCGLSKFSLFISKCFF